MLAALTAWMQKAMNLPASMEQFRMKCSCVWVFWAALIASGAMARGEGENPAQNPGFEADNLPPWQWSATPDAHAAGEIDLGVTHSGSKSFRICHGATQAPKVLSILSQSVPVTSNTLYDFSIWSKGTDVGNAWVGGGPEWKLRYRLPPRTHDWQKTSGTFFTGPNET